MHLRVWTCLFAITPYVNWVAANSRIAYWTAPRAVVIQDVVIVDGGDMYTADFVDNQTLINDGNGFQWDNQTEYRNSHGMLYNISLSQPFNTSGDANIDDLLNHMPYETVDDLHWVYGAIFGNDHEFYTFGGLPTQGINTSASLYGDVFPPVNHSGTWAPHVSEQNQSNALGAAAFVANGAWTNADPIQSGFWFSGLRSADEGPIWYDATSPDNQLANTTAARLIRVDMSATTAPVWTLLPWDPQVVPRAEAGLVWLPYGVQGLLVAFGGVQLPGDMAVSGIFPNTTYTNDFMNDIVLYDVGSGNWTVQRTLAPFPAQLAAFCTVSVAAQDNSSHQIYVYGGYDGTYNSTVQQDDHPVASDSIWVLSIPQFKWTLLSNGTTEHRRQNHACVKVNSVQMLTVGGDTEYGLPLGLPDYLDVLDLSSGQWTHQYTVEPNEAYKIPGIVVEAVGGSPTGGATIPDDLSDMVRGWLSRPFEGVV